MSEDLIVRYDKPRALGCSRPGCDQTAEYKVVLLLVPSRTYAGRPMRMVSSNVVCADHRERTADPFIDEDGWNKILRFFDEKRARRPWRAGTRVEYVAFESPEDA